MAENANQGEEIGSDPTKKARLPEWKPSLKFYMC